MTTESSGLRQLIASIRHNEVQVVVCNSMVDFTDNVRDLIYFIALAKASNVIVHFIDEELYSDDLDDGMFAELYDLVVPKDDDRYPSVSRKGCR